MADDKVHTTRYGSQSVRAIDILKEPHVRDSIAIMEASRLKMERQMAAERCESARTSAAKEAVCEAALARRAASRKYRYELGGNEELTLEEGERLLKDVFEADTVFEKAVDALIQAEASGQS